MQNRTCTSYSSILPRLSKIRSKQKIKKNAFLRTLSKRQHPTCMALAARRRICATATRAPAQAPRRRSKSTPRRPVQQSWLPTWHTSSATHLWGTPGWGTDPSAGSLRARIISSPTPRQLLAVIVAGPASALAVQPITAAADCFRRPERACGQTLAHFSLFVFSSATLDSARSSPISIPALNGGAARFAGREALFFLLRTWLRQTERYSKFLHSFFQSYN